MAESRWQSFVRLLNGSTLRSIREERQRIEGFRNEVLARVDALAGTDDSVREEVQQMERCREEVTSRLGRLASADHAIVRDVLREILAEQPRKKLPNLKRLVLSCGPQHKNTPLLIAAMEARIPVWLYGDTGSGKTMAADHAADTLGLPFRFISVCPTTTKSEFLGYRDAAGVYHSTPFREMFEGGGVFLIDEIDNGNPSTLSVLNASLANDFCAFPDGNIERHKDSIIVAGANTIGRGADIRYIGRNAQDAATLDRFVYVRMDIDENFENALTGGKWDPKLVTNIGEGGSVSPDEWRDFARKVRKACQDLGIEHIVSPRAIINGQRLIRVGVGRKALEDMCIWRGIREADKTKIHENLN